MSKLQWLGRCLRNIPLLPDVWRAGNSLSRPIMWECTGGIVSPEEIEEYESVTYAEIARREFYERVAADEVRESGDGQ